MNRFLSCLQSLVLTAAFSIASSPLWAQIPQPPEVAARAYMLFDVTANQILAEKDIDAPMEPASLTKLMTAYVVFDALRAGRVSLDQTFTISERARNMPGSRMFVDVGWQVPVEDLLKGMIVQSGNDATVALAEGVGGSVENFVRLMNEQAAVLGMSGTSYKNPEGLTEPGHTTTARDLSVISAHLLQDFPEYARYYSIREYRYAGTPEANSRNRNRLLFRDPTVDGLKTGYTEAAGFCMIATANRDVQQVGKRRLIAIVLGASGEDARAAEAQKLLNWGYVAYDAVKLFDAAQPVETPRIWKGAQDTIRIGRFEPIVVAIPSGSRGKVESVVERPEPLLAPIARDQSMGKLKMRLGGETLREINLVALEGVEPAGVFGRAWDAIRLWLK